MNMLKKMWKSFWGKFCLSFVLGLSFTAQALAASVMVDGEGIDRNAAMRDAARLAVEQAVGAYVQSNTLVQNAQVVLDEIYSHAEGYVQKMDVLSEGQQDGVYHVRARVEVSTTPDSALAQRLERVMRLDDPRIGVVILREGTGSWERVHDEDTESAMEEQLMSAGFHHVVDINQVARLQDSAMLNAIYRGDARLTGAEANLPLDYLVIGRVKTSGYPVRLPNGHGGYKTSLLSSARANVTAKVMDFSTGNIVGTLQAAGQGVENSPELAEGKANQVAAQNAAQKVAAIFNRAGQQVFMNVRLVARVASYAQAENFLTQLRNLSGVQDVYLRSVADNLATYDLANAGGTRDLIRKIKAQASMQARVESVNQNELHLDLLP